MNKSIRSYNLFLCAAVLFWVTLSFVDGWSEMAEHHQQQTAHTN
jgi:hypothetical protein